MTFCAYQPNAPISRLVSDYDNKDSGRVGKSRKEIRRRFGGLDGEDQLQVMKLFLSSSSLDRKWAYHRLADWWDNSLEPLVRQLWESHHEPACASIVIRYSPLEYVKENMDSFTGTWSYYLLCRRLGEDPSFCIDKERLSAAAYLSAMSHTGRTLPESEGLSLIYQTMHDNCVKDFTQKDRSEFISPTCTGPVVGPRDFREVAVALNNLDYGLKCTRAARHFRNWAVKVQDDIIHSPEFRDLTLTYTSVERYENNRIGIGRKYAYLALDDKYKSPLDPPADELMKSKGQKLFEERFGEDFMEII